MLKKMVMYYLAVMLTPVLGVILLLPFAAHAGGYGAGDYGVNQVRRAAVTQSAVVVNVQVVRLSIDASNTARAIGGVGGAAACGAATERVQNVWVRMLVSTGCAGVGDSIAQAVAGEERRALQVTIRFPDGGMLTVTQEDNGERLMMGDRVLLIRGDADRVVKA